MHAIMKLFFSITICSFSIRALEQKPDTEINFLFFNRAWDCINATVVDETKIPPTFMNFSQFWSIYNNSATELDPTGTFMPMQHHLTIYNKSRLFINLEGCVNTLRGECKEFTANYGRNGSGDTAEGRFQCYYNKVRQFLCFFQHQIVILSTYSNVIYSFITE